MKIAKILFAFVLLIALSLTGCGEAEPDTDRMPNDTSDSQNVYSSLITLLESELKQLRAEQGEYRDRIEQLEKELEEAKQTSNNSSDTTTQAPDTEEEPSPFTYKITDGKAEITAYSGNYSVLVIPDKLDGYEVVSIEDSVFAGNTKLTSVSLPQGLVRVGWFAFSGCTSLQSITLPQSVENIGYDAFAYCTKLTVYCKSGSYAEKYAQSYGIRCIAN